MSKRYQPRFEHDVVTAPAHWAPYLVNGDSDGMEPKDLASAMALSAEYKCALWWIEPCTVADFQMYDGLYVDCVEFHCLRPYRTNEVSPRLPGK